MEVYPVPAKVAATTTHLYYVEQRPEPALVARRLSSGTMTRVPYDSRGPVTGLAATSTRVFIAENSMMPGQVWVGSHPGEGDLLVWERGEPQFETLLPLHGAAPLRTDSDRLYLRTHDGVHSLEGYQRGDDPLVEESRFDYAVHRGWIYWSDGREVLARPAR